MADMAAGVYSQSDLKKQERDLLGVLGFEVSCPTPYRFLHAYIRSTKVRGACMGRRMLAWQPCMGCMCAAHRLQVRQPCMGNGVELVVRQATTAMTLDLRCLVRHAHAAAFCMHV